MNIQQFEALVIASHPEFIEFKFDDYYNQFVATTELPATVLTYDREEGTYTVSFNGGQGTGETVEEAKAAFEEDYDRIMRNYELSILNNRLS